MSKLFRKLIAEFPYWEAARNAKRLEKARRVDLAALRAACDPKLVIVKSMQQSASLRAEHLKRQAARHAAAHADLHAPINEETLRRVAGAARAGKLSQQDVQLCNEAHAAGRALPTSVLRKLSGA